MRACMRVHGLARRVAPQTAAQRMGAGAAAAAAPHPPTPQTPHRKKMVASAAARICTPHFFGKASMAAHGMFCMSRPAHSMPITRGRRSCHATNAPIWDAAHSSSVAHAAWPGRKAEPMEKKRTAGGEGRRGKEGRGWVRRGSPRARRRCTAWLQQQRSAQAPRVRRRTSVHDRRKHDKGDIYAGVCRCGSHGQERGHCSGGRLGGGAGMHRQRCGTRHSCRWEAVRTARQAAGPARRTCRLRAVEPQHKRHQPVPPPPLEGGGAWRPASLVSARAIAHCGALRPARLHGERRAFHHRAVVRPACRPLVRIRCKGLSTCGAGQDWAQGGGCLWRWSEERRPTAKTARTCEQTQQNCNVQLGNHGEVLHTSHSALPPVARPRCRNHPPTLVPSAMDGILVLPGCQAL